MTDAITQNVVIWARGHDWGADAYLSGGAIKGLFECNDPTADGKTPVEINSRRELLTWAGY